MAEDSRREQSVSPAEAGNAAFSCGFRILWPEAAVLIYASFYEDLSERRCV